MLGFIVLFLFSYALWALFNASLNIQVLALGLPLSLIVAMLSSKFLFHRLTPAALHPKRFASGVLYLIGFVKALLLANLSVLAIILSPSPRISPGVVKISMGDANEVVLASVADSITLTPGTLTIEAVSGSLYVHAINVNPKEGRVEMKRSIVGDFEHNVRGVFQ